MDEDGIGTELGGLEDEGGGMVIVPVEDMAAVEGMGAVDGSATASEPTIDGSSDWPTVIVSFPLNFGLSAPCK